MNGLKATPIDTAWSSDKTPGPPQTGAEAYCTPTALQPETLSGAQIKVITDAKQRRKKLDRAAAVAATSGWITAVLAALGAPFAMFGWESAVMVCGLAAVAYHEFKGKRMIQALNPAATRLLGVNQLAFAALIIAYSVWQIAAALSSEGHYASAIVAEPMLADALEPIEQLYTVITLTVYAAMIIGTLAFQGGTAWYYLSRAKYLRAYVEQMPAWVIDLQRCGAL
jgi:hypothetical protein